MIAFVINTDEDVERELQKARIERMLTPATYFEEDFASFSSYVLARKHEDSDSVHRWATYVDVADDLEISHNLLLGPWTEESTRLLYWLVKGGAHFDWLNSTSGEVSGCQSSCYS